MGTLLPKPFLPLAGVPLLIHTVRSLARSHRIARIVIVVAEEREALCREIINAHGPFVPSIDIVSGGAERQDSVRCGLEAIGPECEIVVIHDAARPFISAEIIDRSITVAAECGSALVAIPARDTIKRVGSDGTITATVPRQELWLAQTPQTFRLSLIRAAHARAQAEGYQATDDAALVEWMGGIVRVVPGDPRNFKITTPDDLILAEAIVQTNPL